MKVINLISLFLLPLLCLKGQESTNNEIIFAGIENAVKIEIKGVPFSQLTFAVSDGLVRKGDSLVYIKPKQNDIVLKIISKGKVVGTRSYDVRKIPNPIISINGKRGGKITRYQLLFPGFLRLSFREPYVTMRLNANEVFQVISFKIEPPSHHGKISMSNRFTSEQKTVIRNMRKGQVLYISEIKVRQKNGALRNISQAQFTIGD